VLYGMHGARPIGILHSIAGGLIGKTAAQQGGLATAALGLVLHFVIATGAAAVFWFASRRFSALTKHAVTSGLVFGAAVYVFMKSVVLPLSAYHAPVWPLSFELIPILGHMLFVGLPIALAARAFSTREAIQPDAGAALQQQQPAP
jgi:uncharacterized membrane protein YagU involved in acid resistance